MTAPFSELVTEDDQMWLSGVASSIISGGTR